MITTLQERHSSYVLYFAFFIGMQLLAYPSISAIKATPPAAVYRINAGGGNANTSLGNFKADQYFSSPSYKKSTTQAIAGTTDDIIYRTERWGTKTLNYNLPVSNGKYKVVLHFAEIIYILPGKRVFDVSLEGLKVLDNYDIVKKAGPNTATTETFIVTVSDGMINLNFNSAASVGGVDNPKISAIEVMASGSSNAPIVSVPIADQNCVEGSLFNFAIPTTCFTDADNDPLTYSCKLTDGAVLPSWLNFNAENRTFSGTPSADTPRSLSVRVTVSDGNGGLAIDDFTLNINHLPVGVPQEIYLSEGQNFSFTPFADPDNDSLTISYELYLPQQGMFEVPNHPYWLNYNPSNQTFSGTLPTDFPSFESYFIELTATADDGKGGTASTFALIFCELVNNPPKVAKSFPDIFVPKGEVIVTPSIKLEDYFQDDDQRYYKYEFTFSFLSEDGGPAPEWFYVNDNFPDGYYFVIAPPADAPDSVIIKVSARDSWGAEVISNFVVYTSEQNTIAQTTTTSAFSSARIDMGEKNTSYKTDITASPNPFINNLNIDIAATQKEEYEVRVHDLLGRELSFKKVNSSNLQSETISLDFSNTAAVSDSRIFLVTVENKTKTFRKVLRVLRD
jgi:hypothetical protein